MTTTATRPIIVLDPGHGGSAPSAGSSPNRARGPNGLLEKDVVLDLAQRVRARLSPFADVRLTRDRDVNVSLADRSALARQNAARAFVSLHLNGADDPNADGAEAWVARDSSTGSRQLAESLLARIARATSAQTRGVGQRDLGVLVPSRHDPNTAAVLLEIAYLSNPAQARRFETPEYRETVATAIADSLRDAVSVPAVATGCSVDGADEDFAVSLAAPSNDDIIAALDAILGTSYGNYAGYRAALVNDTLFGKPVSGVHPDFLRQLKAAETEAGRQINPTDWQIDSVGGYRASSGMHNWGLAIDLNYDRCPFIMHERGEGALDGVLGPIYHRITLMMTGSRSVIPADITQGAKSMDRTRRLYDALSNESDAMRMYFTLLNPDSLRDFLAHIGSRDWAGIFGDSRQPTFDNVQQVIAADYVALCGHSGPSFPGLTYPPPSPVHGDRPFAGNPRKRAPELGFMSLRRGIVLALSAQGLRWGAIDFGGESGDIMHFDALGSPLGGAIQRAKQRAATPTRAHAIELSGGQATPDQVVQQFDRDTHSTYGDYAGFQRSFVTGTFFGQSLSSVRPEFLTQLQNAERAATTALAGRPHGIRTAHVFRPAAGWHGWGMAVDINYNEAPYIMHEAGKGAFETELGETWHRIARIMLGRDSVIPREITRGSRSAQRTSQLYDQLLEESEAMKRYFAMLDPVQLSAFVASPPPRNWDAITNGPPAGGTLQPLIANDYVTLAGRPGPTFPGVTYPSPRPAGRLARPFAGGNPRLRAPEHGFLNIPKEIVTALSAQGLRWGAIDFGPESGDVMHFDAAESPLAASITRAKRTASGATARSHALDFDLPARAMSLARTPYIGNPYTPSSSAALFACAPAPVNVLPATLLPASSTTPDPEIEHALTTNGLSAAQVTTFRTNGGFDSLRAFARVFSGPAMAELLARLRYGAAQILDPPHDHGSNLNRALGVRHSAEILGARLLLAVPGHFRELARRAPDDVEAHALESIGWLLMRSLADDVASDTGKHWWVPSAPAWVSAFANPLPALGSQIATLITRLMFIDTTMPAADQRAHFNAWSTGLAGQHWKLETGRTTHASGAGLPLYASAISAPAVISIAAQKSRIDQAWSARVAAVDARFPRLSADSTRELQRCDNGPVASFTGNASTGGVQLVTTFPMLVTASPSIVRRFTVLNSIVPVVEHLFRNIADLGWNDLLFETQGAGCFRGKKIPGNASAARDISEHGHLAAIDLMVFENQQRASTSTQDPRIVALFEAHNFRWGFCFRTTDPHHFEYR